MVPRPLASNQLMSKLLHVGQNARGYQMTVAHALQRGKSNFPALVASQKALVSTLMIGGGAGSGRAAATSVMRLPFPESASSCPCVSQSSRPYHVPGQFHSLAPGPPVALRREPDAPPRGSWSCHRDWPGDCC